MFANVLVEDTWKRSSHLKFLKDLARVRRLRLKRLTRRIKYEMKVEVISNTIDEKNKLRQELLRQSKHELRALKRLSRKLVRLRRRRRWLRYRRVRVKLHRLRMAYANGLASLEKVKLQLAKLKKSRLKYKRLSRSVRIPRLPKYRPRKETRRQASVDNRPPKASKKPARRAPHHKRVTKKPANRQARKEAKAELPSSKPKKSPKSRSSHSRKPRRRPLPRSISPILSGDYRAPVYGRKMRAATKRSRSRSDRSMSPVLSADYRLPPDIKKQRRSTKRGRSERKRRTTPSQERKPDADEQGRPAKMKKRQSSASVKKVRKRLIPYDSLQITDLRLKSDTAKKKRNSGRRKSKGKRLSQSVENTADQPGILKSSNSGRRSTRAKRTSFRDNPIVASGSRQMRRSKRGSRKSRIHYHLEEKPFYTPEGGHAQAHHILEEPVTIVEPNATVTKYGEPAKVHDEKLRQAERQKVQVEAVSSVETIYQDDEPKTKMSKREKKSSRHPKGVNAPDHAEATPIATKKRHSIQIEHPVPREYVSSSYSASTLTSKHAMVLKHLPPEQDDGDWSRKKLAQMRLEAESEEKRDSASTFAEFSVSSNRRLFNEKYGGIERVLHRASWHRNRVDKDKGSEKSGGAVSKRSSSVNARLRPSVPTKRLGSDEAKRRKRMSDEIRAARQRYEAMRNAKTPRLDSIDNAHSLSMLPLRAISVHGLLRNPHVMTQKNLKRLLAEAVDPLLKAKALKKQMAETQKDADAAQNQTEPVEERASATRRSTDARKLRQRRRPTHQEDAAEEWVPPEDNDSDVFAPLNTSKTQLHTARASTHYPKAEINIFQRPSIRSQTLALDEATSESDNVRISTLMQVRRSRLESYNRMVNARVKRSSSHPQYLGKGRWELKRKRKKSTELTPCGMPCCKEDVKEDCCKFTPKLRKASSSTDDERGDGQPERVQEQIAA